MVLAKGEVGRAMVGVEAAEEAEVPLLLFLVLVLLRAFGRGAKSGEQGEKCVLVGDHLEGEHRKAVYFVVWETTVFVFIYD